MKPPRLARALLNWWLDPRLTDAVVGDLEELFACDAADSPWRARVVYWLRAAGVVWHLSHRRPLTIGRQSGDYMMSTLWKDFTQGLRLFVTQPGYTWAAVATLALAIGANTFIFSIANVLIFKPLPIRDPDRLGWILTSGPSAAQDRGGVSLPEFALYHDRATAFDHLAAWRRVPVTMRADRESERVVGQWVIGNLHELWGLHARLGRTLQSADESSGRASSVVLSHRFWNVRFGAAADVVGRDLLVNGQRHTVVGVLTPDIELGNLSDVDLWLPYAGDPALASPTERGWRPVGHLAGAATVTDAHAQVSAIAAHLARERPETNQDWTSRVGSTRDAMGGKNTWVILSLLFTVVGLLLVLACANIMNLLIARLIGRRQELGVRTALGATRGRLVRQIVTESLLLGLVGGTLGLGLAGAGLRGMHAIATEPFFQQVALDVRVMAFAVGLALVAPIVFSVVPTLRALRTDVRPSLNDASGRSLGGHAAARGRAVLVVVQVSLAVTLLVVAGLVVQSVRAVIAADLGYDPTPLLSAEIDVPSWKMPDDRDALRLRARLLERVQALSGARGAALTTSLPALDFPEATLFDITGHAEGTPRDRPSAGLVVTSADFFSVVGVPIVAGRAFELADAAAPRAVAVVSREAVRRYWGGLATAVGASIRIASSESRGALDATVIGVAADTVTADFAATPSPSIYVLDQHRPTRSMYVVVRAETPTALAAGLRVAVRETDPDLPVFRLRTVLEGFADENSSNRLLSAMFAAFAGIAVLLATAGLYGVMSHAVSQRTAEIAVRMALGASAREVARNVVGGSVKLAVLGTLIGLAGAFGLAQTMTSILFGVTASDAATYIASAGLVLAAAVIAAWVPMRRAALIDPIQSLRRA